MQLARLALAAACCTLAAQTLPPGPQVLAFQSAIDGSDQPYAVYIPKRFDAKKRYPLVVSLHGAYSNHRLNLRRVLGESNRPGETDAEASRYFPALPDVDFIVASTLARGTMGYRGVAETDVWAMIDDVKKRFPIDEDRMYLTGLSMGGGGTLEIGLLRPDLWAAIAPLCPVPPYFGESHAANVLNVPVYFHHGDADPVVPVKVSRDWSKLMKDAGVDVNVKEYPGVQHNVWEPAYKDAAIFKWFAQHKRNRFPDRVRYASQSLRFPGAYWVEFLAIPPGKTATIDARFTAPNRVEVTSQNLPAFSLALAGHPKYDAKKPLTVIVNGEPRTFAAGEAPRFGTPAAATPVVNDVTAARHVYVYGTADKPSREEAARRREVATQAAEWVGGGQRVAYFARVIPDSQVRPSDEEANLILFGDAATNSLIAKHASRAPLALRAGKGADHGLIYAMPGEKSGTLIVVNSGLPFWTGGERTQRGGYGFLPLQHRILMSIGEFLLFKDDVRTVLSEGVIAEKKASLPADVVEVK